MSWEEDLRRNIERTRQRIMEIAPDMLDLNAHRSSAGRFLPKNSTSELSFASRFRTHTTASEAISSRPRSPSGYANDQSTALPSSLVTNSSDLWTQFGGSSSGGGETHAWNSTSVVSPVHTLMPSLTQRPARGALTCGKLPDGTDTPCTVDFARLPTMGSWPGQGSTGCYGSDCYNQFVGNGKIAGLGELSAQTNCLPVFSMSTWDNGHLTWADCGPLHAYVKMIDGTIKGDKIDICMCAWYDQAWPVVVALKNAYDRGVVIRILAHGIRCGGSWVRTDCITGMTLKSFLGDSYRTWSAPAPLNNALHNKFMLIHRRSDRPSDRRFFVVNSGMNWAVFDLSRNVDVMIANNASIYNMFRFFFDSLWEFSVSKDKSNLNITPQVTWKMGDIAISAHFWPTVSSGQLIAKNHPFVAILDEFVPGPNTKIRVIAASWSTGLPLDRLIEHRNGGSDVRVAANHHRDLKCHGYYNCCTITPGKGDIKSCSNEVETSMPCETEEGVWVKLHGDNIYKKRIPWAKIASHSKVLLISGPLKNGGKRSSVYTGSLNWSAVSNVADSFIGIHNDPLIFSQYENWWNWLCKNTALNKGGTLSMPNPCGPVETLP
jgi:hypothetical protein